MHEMSVAMAMVEQVAEAAAPHGHRSATAVRLRLGELAGVVPDSLRFCFGLVSAGTVLDGAELLIEDVPGRARCVPCAAEWATGMPPRLDCPHCGGARVEMLAGRELQVAAVRWAGPEEPSGPNASVDPAAVRGPGGAAGTTGRTNAGPTETPERPELPDPTAESTEPAARPGQAGATVSARTTQEV